MAINYYEGHQSAELENLFEKDANLAKFVNELCFNFPSLRVMGIDKDVTTWVTFCGDKHGLLLLKARVGKAKDVDSSKDDQVPNYMIYTPWYSKERGRSERARRTLFSIKLSSLIGTMKRNKVIPTDSEVIPKMFINMRSELHDSIRRAVQGDRRHLYKSSGLMDTDAYHIFLKILLNNESQDLMLRLDRSKLKAVLDTYDEVDKMEEESKNIVNSRLYNTDLYGIGVCSITKNYLVGKFRFDKGVDDAVVLEPMKRVKSISESYPEFIPFFTMLKVAREDEGRSLENHDNLWFDSRNKYDLDFEIGFTSSNQGDGGYSGYVYWLIVPCSAI